MAMARRSLLKALGAMAATRANAAEDQDRVGAPLQPWRRGGLDIHHIATGRGDCSFIIGPDGTGLMIDAGAMYQSSPMNLPEEPNESRYPGEWIVRYVLRRLLDTKRSGIDALLVTHLHPDHLGDVAPQLPRASAGGYQLTGVSEIAAKIPIGLILDRGYPHYNWPSSQTAPFARNYIAFIRARLKAGGRVERFQAGRGDQISLTDPGAFPTFDIRNLAANGEVWDGQGDGARSRLPPMAALSPGDIPDENVLSCALRLSYGNFRYFAAGDLTSNTLDGALPWRDVATPAAEACGPVNVAVAPHHGLFDSSSAGLVRALRARIWLIDAWHVSHPGMTALERIYSERLYAGPRDVLSTGLSTADALVNDRLTRRFASNRGHIVVRVSPGARRYNVVVTDNSDERDRVTKVLGPFEIEAR
jgi:beta-lactamase superfamily II metal-dependent hydrolase